MTDKRREVLQKFATKIEGMDSINYIEYREGIDTALAELNKIYLECVPKEWNTKYNAETKDQKMIKQWEFGFNDCLELIRANINKL